MTGIEFKELLESWTSQIRILQCVAGLFFLWLVWLTYQMFNSYARIAHAQRITKEEMMKAVAEEIQCGGSFRKKVIGDVPLCHPHGQKTIKVDKVSSEDFEPIGLGPRPNREVRDATDDEIDRYNKDVEEHNRKVEKENDGDPTPTNNPPPAR